MNELTSINPIDGRYRKQTEALEVYFSEFALIKYRVFVEIEYFIALIDLNLSQLDKKKIDKKTLQEISNNFSIDDAKRIKEIEQTTNHDVKAVEYFIKEKLELIGYKEISEFVHFGLTSQDINNTAIPLSIKHALENCIIPQIDELISTIKNQATDWKDIPMLARTHGQPASPTRLGKEWQVFQTRIEIQKNKLINISHAAKFGGATGNLNAHHVAFPTIDWNKFAANFVAKLGLTRSYPTTQIEHYDTIAEMCDCMKRINTILIDFSRDVWQYISMDYFKQKLKQGEIGSSAMPHKVNPIDFENAEGNFGMANAVFEHLSAKLPISRLQRDLTDSTVLRNIGVPFGYSLIAFKSLLKGLNKLVLNEEKLKQDLDSNWAVVAEAIQTILRREGYPNPYEALKMLTRTNEKIEINHIKTFINELEISEEIKSEMRKITPQNYTGI